MKDSADQLTIAHIAALRGDAILQSFVGQRVFNFLPRETPYPYVVYHIPDSNEWDADGCNGEEHSVYIHVWDDKEGSKRAREIMQRVYELLHDNEAFSLTDHKLVNCQRVTRSVSREGQLYHGIEIFRAVTEEV